MPEPTAPLTIWCNVDFSPLLRERVRENLGPHRLIQPAATSANNLAGAAADAALEQADVAWGQPDPEQVARLPRLKWVQLTTAGYTRYDTDAFRAAVRRNGTAVCNASSVYAEPCAQHLAAMMLALCRRLPHSLENQRGPREWPYLPLRSDSMLLNGQTVLLVGYGAIARRLAELLAPFQMNLIGFRRRPKSEGEPARVLAIDELDEWLPRAQHVVNVLPASAETKNFFSAERFARMHPDAFYYNIGRGTTNDESALAAALRGGRPAAAYLDAFAIEPLPPEHPLWTTPNCYVTPHTAGGHETEYQRHADLFFENLRRLQRGQALIDRVM